MDGWRLSRLAVALGGLVILVGIFIIGISVLARVGMADLDIFFSDERGRLFLWALLAVGLLDLVCGIILAYKQR